MADFSTFRTVKYTSPYLEEAAEDEPAFAHPRRLHKEQLGEFKVLNLGVCWGAVPPRHAVMLC